MRWFASSSSGPGSEAAAEPLLTPELIDALSGLEIRSATRRRRASEGVHPAIRHGREEEFFQHRPYVRGDDLRAVDWRASARSGHPLLKERHQPSRRPLTLLVDTSASMAFPGTRSKLRMAKVLAAALAFLGLRRGDTVVLARLRGHSFERVARLRPAPRALHSVTRALAPLGETGEGDVALGLERVGSSVARHGLAVVLSDLYGVEARILAAVAALRRVGDVALVHVLAAGETQIAPGLTALEELEGGGVVTLPAAAIGEHAVRVAAWRQRLRAGALSAGADWVEADAAEPAVNVLDRWLRRVS